MDFFFSNECGIFRRPDVAYTRIVNTLEIIIFWHYLNNKKSRWTHGSTNGTEMKFNFNFFYFNYTLKSIIMIMFHNAGSFMGLGWPVHFSNHLPSKILQVSNHVDQVISDYSRAIFPITTRNSVKLHIVYVLYGL